MSTELVELPQGRLARPSLLPALPASWDECAEQSLLGALLLLPNLAEEILQVVEPEDFFSLGHQQILRAMRQLRQSGSPIDLITVGAKLAGQPEYEGCGGRNYLSALPTLSVPATNAPHYAQIVRAHSVQRQTQHIGHLLQEGRLTPAEAREMLARLETRKSLECLFALSARQFCSEVPQEPDWVLEGYLARGAITELDAKIKTGKTHFACDLIGSVLAGEDFLGRSTLRTGVLYLSEERPTTFRAALKRVGLEEATDLHVTLRHQARGSWPEIAREVMRKARALQVGLVVVDTLSVWSGIEPEKENDAGAAMEVMRPVEAMAAAGLAVLVLRHERKSGGEVGDSARGSSAFGGLADILLALRKDATRGHDNRRVLEAVGRLEGWEPKLIVEMTEGHYRSLGASAQVEKDKARRTILHLLPTDPDKALPETDILAQAPEEITRSTLKRALGALVDEGVVDKAKGAGIASSRAYGFWQCKETQS